MTLKEKYESLKKQIQDEIVKGNFETLFADSEREEESKKSGYFAVIKINVGGINISFSLNSTMGGFVCQHSSPSLPDNEIIYKPLKIAYENEQKRNK